MGIILCRPKSLPSSRLDHARHRAVLINPANAAEERWVARTPIGRRGGPRRIAVLVARKWPKTGVKLTVSFLDGAKSDLRMRILLHMNAWGSKANVKFVETSGTGQVRISRLDSPEEMAGYWSYIGTEILDIPESEPTMNLERFTMRTSESEFTRVVRHEAGHTLGFEHEHMRTDIVQLIDREKALAFYDEDQGWDEAEVEAQVLTPLARKSIMGTTESDPDSIMCYHLPAEVMTNGKGVRGGTDINPRDHAFAASVYPRVARRASDELDAPAAVPEAGKSPSVEPPRSRDVFELIVLADSPPGGKPSRSAPRPKTAQVLASYRGARATAILRLRADDGEEPTSFGSIIRMHERIKNYTSREKGSAPNDRELMAFGEQLFDALFQGNVRRLYDEARTFQRRRLEVVFTSMIPWIGEKPWEFAYDSGRASFLATEEVWFTRNVLTSVPSDVVAPRSGPLRILIASAQPAGSGPLSIHQEEAVIRRGFESLVEAKLAEVVALPRATPSAIHRHLAHGDFQVVHFIGHGRFDEDRGEGRLVFEDERGEEHLLGERAVRELFCGRNLTLVFLNACETGRGGRVEFNKGMAQALVAHGLPALVANQYSVLDSSATSFAQHFYWSLAQGMSLGQAARESRIAVNCSLRGELIDWAVPVLYARDASLALRSVSERVVVPETGVRRSVREAIERHAVHVAVWDMDGSLPELEKTLATMSRAQREFGFELVDPSVPLDVWDLGGGRAKTYLWAERFVKRLQGLPDELRVNVLVCVTRHPMRDDTTLNLYNWWPDSPKAAPIVVFSAAGFDELPPAGRVTDRVVANLMVQGLAGLLSGAGTHSRGSEQCPLFHNPKRKFTVLSRRQRFEERCRSKLRKVIGSKRLAALEVVLKAFP